MRDYHFFLGYGLFDWLVSIFIDFSFINFRGKVLSLDLLYSSCFIPSFGFVIVEIEFFLFYYPKKNNLERL